jgi:hypothetical protein
VSNWKLNWRIVAVAVFVLSAMVALTLQQHTAAIQAGLPSPISWQVAWWLPIVAVGLSTVALFLPSPFGQSSVAPPGTSETRVVREATREAVVDVLSDAHHPIRRELERQMAP